MHQQLSEIRIFIQDVACVSHWNAETRKWASLAVRMQRIWRQWRNSADLYKTSFTHKWHNRLNETRLFVCDVHVQIIPRSNRPIRVCKSVGSLPWTGTIHQFCIRVSFAFSPFELFRQTWHSTFFWIVVHPWNNDKHIQGHVFGASETRDLIRTPYWVIIKPWN